MRVNSFEIQDLIGNFTAQLMEAVTAQTGRRIQGIVAAALSGSGSAAPLSIGNIGVFRQASKARRLSGKATAARKLQGRYIGALRSLRPADRARVKKMASQEGVGAAVKLALTLK
jgi:aconitase B